MEEELRKSVGHRLLAGGILMPRSKEKVVEQIRRAGFRVSQTMRNHLAADALCARSSFSSIQPLRLGALRGHPDADFRSPRGAFGIFLREMKLVSWNVNGIRSVLGKGFSRFSRQEPKLTSVCLQETKAREDQVGVMFDGY